jgi:hypothetical protein
MAAVAAELPKLLSYEGLSHKGVYNITEMGNMFANI